MKITYDPEADAAYIRFKRGRVEVTTIRLSEDVAIDLGPGEEVVGIEILNASKNMGLGTGRKVELENLQAA
ncbi:MAG: DUF2283 domain-containing protein [Chloroflexi bacterium]|nr:DUF2283 domain-containing protein [Chloroflexota bacterium]MBI4236448.1 DUF2283 domain-containing protein [Chloroflexota bacterium]